MDESTINEWYSFYLFEYQLFISDMITLFCLELITPFFVNVFFSFSIYLLCDTLQFEGGNLAASKIRNLECPNYEICLIDYGCGKFNRKIHIMEQYP